MMTFNYRSSYYLVYAINPQRLLQNSSLVAKSKFQTEWFSSLLHIKSYTKFIFRRVIQASIVDQTRFFLDPGSDQSQSSALEQSTI